MAKHDIQPGDEITIRQPIMEAEKFIARVISIDGNSLNVRVWSTLNKKGQSWDEKWKLDHAKWGCRSRFYKLHKNVEREETK